MLPTKRSSRSKRNVSNAPPPPPRPPSSAPIPNKGVMKEDMICKIIKYQNNQRFGPIVKKELGIKYSRTQLTRYTIDNLEGILHRIRTHLNTRNMDQVFQHMAKVTAKGYEDLVTGFGYNIEGFSDLLLANPAFHDAFERWKIERKIPEIPPSFQLMYIVASTTYVAHLNNAKYTKIQKPPPNTQKTEEIDVVDEPQQQDIVDLNPNPERLKSNFKPGDILS